MIQQWVGGDMNDTKQLEEALALAMQLAPRDRLRLVERVVASVEREITVEQSAGTSSAHWGQQLVTLLDMLDLSDWQGIGSDDPVEWVEQRRAEQAARHQLDWDEAE